MPERPTDPPYPTGRPGHMEVSLPTKKWKTPDAFANYVVNSINLAFVSNHDKLLSLINKPSMSLYLSPFLFCNDNLLALGCGRANLSCFSADICHRHTLIIVLIEHTISGRPGISLQRHRKKRRGEVGYRGCPTSKRNKSWRKGICIEMLIITKPRFFICVIWLSCLIF